ncbi:unnamed protein product [Phytophthora fragariaefolia]|uniref:Unnamed protein product n=1 Tax=Phytophthora fragariaefolia TaxID=1490495 RepID=A0A9W7CXZ6_9STRA|nr:unnamed protein product [Phytophthora fragariaefolia]
MLQGHPWSRRWLFLTRLELVYWKDYEVLPGVTGYEVLSLAYTINARGSSLEILSLANVDLLRRQERPPSAEPVVPRDRHCDHVEVDQSAVGERLLPVISLSGKAKEWAHYKLVVKRNTFPTLESLQSDLRLAFEPPKDESRMRTAFFALRQGKMSMRDYVQKTRHLVSGIVPIPIDVSSQVHVFIFGMREGMTWYCLTRAEPSTLEASFILALREDYTVPCSYARALTSDAQDFTSELMEIDAIDAESRSRSTSTARGPRFNNDNRPRDGRPLICYRCRVSDHRAAVCRAPAPVLESAEVVGEADDMFPAAHPKNGQDQYVQGGLLAGTEDLVPQWQPALLLADDKSHRAPRRAVPLAYTFDGFSTNVYFLVIELNYAFDCILWLARYQPELDWLARSVRRRAGYDVSEVFTHLLVAPSRRVVIVDRTSTTHPPQRESDGPRCVESAASAIGPASNPRLRACEGMERNTVEQRLSYEKNAVEQSLPHENNPVEQRLPYENNAVDQRHSHVKNAVSSGSRSPMIPSRSESSLRNTCMIETEIPCLEVDEVSSSETAGSSSGSRRPRKSKRNRSGRRRLPRRSTAVDQAPLRENVNVVEYSEGSPNQIRTIEVANSASDAATILRLPGFSWMHFLRDLKAGEIKQVYLLTGSDQPAVLANAVSDDASSSRPKAAEPKPVRAARFAAQPWSALQDSNNPVYSLAHEFEDIFPKKIPAKLLAERGVRQEIDLVPGAKYCVTRQWPLPRDMVQAIDDFFEGRLKDGRVRESISPHSSPTFCVRKATGGWRVVHAFNKLSDATIPAQTFIPRKDMVLDTMSGSVIYSAIDLTEGFYQILMRESDIPLTAVSTPSGMLWEWLIIPQGLKNMPTTFNRMDYAGLIRPMSSLLEKEVAWNWCPEHQDAFDAVKKSLASEPVLVLPDTSSPFHMVCDASDFAIGRALIQFDDEDRERVVSYQSRQMKPAEKHYPVHDKELLAMRYALIKFRVYLLGEQTFAVFTDHASLRTAMKSPHLSQRMARWISFFTEYNFVVHYKPSKNNILADALSRSPIATSGA